MKRALLIPAALLVLQVGIPDGARADDDRHGAVRLLCYAGCALAVVGAITPIGLAGAIVGCAYLFATED